MRIAVIGAGGIGGYLGAKLWKAGHDVVFVARGSHLDRLQQRGLRLESPDGDILARATFTSSLRGHAPCELSIVAVKSFDTRPAAALIREVLTDTSDVVTFQNGVENEAILSELLGGEPVLGGVAFIFSTIRAPGIVSHTGGTGKFLIGEMNGSSSRRVAALGTVFTSAGIQCTPTPTIRRALWEKWIFICALGGATAYARTSIDRILPDSKLKDLVMQAIRETILVAEATTGEDFSGFDEKVFSHLRRLPAGSTSSMYYDVMHGKRTEVEALNGAVVRFGRETHIPTPANSLIAAALGYSAG